LAFEAAENHTSRLAAIIAANVDSYEVEAQEFFQKETENVKQLIAAVRSAAKVGEDAIKPLVDKLDGVARNWDKVAQPIKLNAKARGTSHELSIALGFSIRGLAVELFNEHQMLEQSKKINELLRDVFSELPELAERVEEDASALRDITHEIKQLESQQKEWEQDITYSVDIGTLSKTKLSISPTGVSWGRQHFPLASIGELRWGGTG
jgi:hypothetical protein